MTLEDDAKALKAQIVAVEEKARHAANVHAADRFDEEAATLRAALKSVQKRIDRPRPERASSLPRLPASSTPSWTKSELLKPTPSAKIPAEAAKVDERWRTGSVRARPARTIDPVKRGGLAGRLLGPTKEAQQRAADTQQQEIQVAHREAQIATDELRRMCQQAVDWVSELPQLITWADNAINRARNEFTANAFGPFWDMVEGAANNLGAVNERYRLLDRSATNYYASLKGKSHTFGVFPVDFLSLPRIDAQVTRLAQVVRSGQTNFQFANIWEHRQTRQVLIAGFQTLGAAISGLSSAVSVTVGSLERTLTTESTKLIREHERTRTEHGEMLDNIQRGTKPFY